MDKSSVRLHQKQVDVLNWIKAGCPDGVYEQGHEHRIIARALERRGLVTISGSGSTWKAVVTAAGRAWEVARPTDVLPDQSQADELIERVLASGGRLVLPVEWRDEEALERLVRMSLRSPNRPRGKKLEARSTGRWDQNLKEVVVVEHFDDDVEQTPVPVPDRVAKYHAAVKAFLDDKDWQYVSREHLPRAARILQAIADEAPKRGMAVSGALPAKGTAQGYRRSGATPAHLRLKTSAGEYTVKIREVSASGGQPVPVRGWNERKTRSAWLEARAREFIATGQLELVVDGPGARYAGHRYQDTKTIRLEDKLPDLFRSLEIYRRRAEWQAAEQQRLQLERQQQWETAMERARRRYAEHVRWEHFKQCSEEWQAGRQHRSFLAAARSLVSDIDDVPGRAALVAQLDLAERILDKVDPLQHPERLVPRAEDPKPEDLKPFLDGWSPYGPERLNRW